MTEQIHSKKTIYLRNLNEKVSINTLKSKLQERLTPYGEILAIKALKSLKLKGQAFVTFVNSEDANKAVESLNKGGLNLWNQQVEIKWANNDSDESMKQHLNEEEFDQYVNKRKEEKQIKEKSIQQAKIRSQIASNPPNKTILLQDLPNSVKSETLESKFNPYKGFVTVRFVEVRHVAFIEFENVDLAKTVLEEIRGNWVVDGITVEVNYAKQ
ncbi:hypothetical protein WICPIJ_006525 [Wickerhamomyces pijperi]|uniref:RRM domain-containing protein n=1 Tax=Wickerhamomyces pijperi TaxID=599730 RepID=A0A9P8Q3S7_WICPI|nr:hypothetical protein WICPIJ_006525 [Wickerhamomyces pijperi]